MTAYAVQAAYDNRGLRSFCRACAMERRAFARQHVVQKLRQCQGGCCGAVDGFRRLRLPQFSVLIRSHSDLLFG